MQIFSSHPAYDSDCRTWQMPFTTQDSYETISEFDGADKILKHVQGKWARQSNDYGCVVWVAAGHGEFDININDIIEFILNPHCQSQLVLIHWRYGNPSCVTFDYPKTIQPYLKHTRFASRYFDSCRPGLEFRYLPKTARNSQDALSRCFKRSILRMRTAMRRVSSEAKSAA